MVKRVVITGIGPLSCIGRERETFWQSLVKGISGIKKIERLQNSPRGFRTWIAGEIDFSPAPFLDLRQARRYARFTQFSIVASALALADAHLKITPQNRSRTGIVLGTGIGGLDIIQEQFEALATDGLKHLNPFAANASIPNAATGEIAVFFGINGPNYTVSTGCSASGNAIGLAMDMIRSGRADAVISGGAETPLTDIIYSTFDVSKQLSAQNENPEKAVKPFDMNRDGYLLSEGGSMLILEELEHALARHAYIYAEVVGFGSAADAYNSFKMEEAGVGMAAAMKNALHDAGITPLEIDYICAHGSGSKSADRKETNAIKSVFGQRAKYVPISTIKSVMGMPFGASTGFQTMAAALMLDNQIIIPTMNLETPDPECDLDYVPQKARETILNYAMIDSMGLGGNNAVLILKKYEK